jgi:hypothetical protein
MVPVMVDSGTRRARQLDLLAGRKLEYVRLGPAVVLSFAGGGQVLLETPARLDRPGGGRVEIDPAAENADAVAGLLGDVVCSAWARRTGELHLAFESGAVLSVAPDPDVESWAFTGPGGLLIVCLAQGEVAVWGA